MVNFWASKRLVGREAVRHTDSVSKAQSGESDKSRPYTHCPL